MTTTPKTICVDNCQKCNCYGPCACNCCCNKTDEDHKRIWGATCKCAVCKPVTDIVVCLECNQAIRLSGIGNRFCENPACAPGSMAVRIALKAWTAALAIFEKAERTPGIIYQPNALRERFEQISPRPALRNDIFQPVLIRFEYA